MRIEHYQGDGSAGEKGVRAIPAEPASARVVLEDGTLRMPSSANGSIIARPEMQGGCLDAHPCFGTSIHAFVETLDGVWMEQSKNYISSDRASMLHPGLGGWNSLCENRIRLVVLIILPQTRAL